MRAQEGLPALGFGETGPNKAIMIELKTEKTSGTGREMDVLGTEKPELKGGGRVGRLQGKNAPDICPSSSESCLFWPLLDLGLFVTENGQLLRGLKERCDKI